MFRRGCQEILRLERLRWRRRPDQVFHWRSCTSAEQITDHSTSAYYSRLTRRLFCASTVVPSSNGVRGSSSGSGSGTVTYNMADSDYGGPLAAGVPPSPAVASGTSTFGRQESSSASGSVTAESSSAEGTAVSPGSAEGVVRESSTCADAESEASSSDTNASGGRKGGRLFRVLRAGIGLSAGIACTAAGYATYAYNTDDLENRLGQLQSEWFPRSSSASSFSSDSDDLAWGGSREILDTFGVESAAKNACLSTARMYLDARRSVEDQIKGFAAPSSEKLLPDLAPEEVGIYTLVLDLDESLVYADWRRDTGWRTFKRPGVEAFLEEMSKYFEIVIYTDHINMYGDPVMARLDPKGYVRFKLYRDATQYTKGKHMRDLSKLNRDPAKVLYLSGHGLENCMQLENVVPLKAWKAEPGDATLLDLMPFLECIARQRPPDVRVVLESYKGQDIPAAFRERSKEVQRRLQERRGHSFWNRAVTSGPRTSAAH